jgi:HCO3- transporter family
MSDATSSAAISTSAFNGDDTGASEAAELAAAEATAAADKAEASVLFEGLGKGIVRDYRARLPHFWSDVKDGLSVQCVAASLFLFFACLAPAVGFGGLFAKATGGAIGTVEMVTSTAACGILYALLAAQPLTIIGSTGPVLAFVACLAALAQSLSLPFLPLYAWTGLWTGGILAAFAVTSGSNLVKYLTRFTDEIFSTLISTIFIVEAVSDVARTFASPASTFTKALLTLVCATITYAVSTTLKSVRQSVYFNKATRKTISNFAPTVGVVAASLVAKWACVTQGAAVAALPALTIPDVFGTTSGRPWLVPLGDLPVWARWASLLPALMASVLLFLDQNITVRLVNNPRWKMTKGRREKNVVDGMHADLLVVSILTVLQSLFGIPWLVAATVRSLSHVGALSKYDDKGKIVGTIEQRLTGVVIHALIGCCVLFAKPRTLLKQVPLPVLMGLFMFLGTSALPGNEMWERFLELFKDGRMLLTAERRWSAVPRRVTNLFTVIQVGLLAAMFGLKESSIGVLFPVVIALLAPIRFGLEKAGIIKAEYMELLDED